MEKKIKVSIIIPVYNVEEYIEECIKSVLEQTLLDIEIIIINDGTKDRSIDKIEKYLKDSRIILINKENEGLSEARNEGLKIAKGKYLYHLDSDDFIDLNLLKDTYEYAEKKRLDIIIFDIFILKNGKIKVKKDTNFKENKVYTSRDYLENYFQGEASRSIWNKLIKKDLYHKNNIYHPKKISYGEDAAVLPQLIVNAERIGKLEKAYIYYRQREGSLTKRRGKNYIADHIESYKISWDYLKIKEKEEFLKSNEFIYKFNHLYLYILSIGKKYIDIELYNTIVEDICDKNNEIKYSKNSIRNKIKKLFFNCIYKKNPKIGERIYEIMIFIKNRI